MSRSNRVVPYVVDPPPPSGIFERLMLRPKNSRIAPAPAPPPAPAAPPPVDPILTFTPTSKRSLRSRLGFGSSRVDPRHAGIRRSRKMRKSKRRKGRTRTRRRH